MKLIFSSFANEIVDEDLEVVQKALVIAHQHYASKGDYDEALKITNLLAENLDKGKCFEISVMNENTKTPVKAPLCLRNWLHTSPHRDRCWLTTC